MRKAPVKPNPLFIEVFQIKPRKGELKKLELIEEAIRQIAHQPIETVTLESIGKPLGMIRAHVAYYYKTLESLMSEIALPFFTTSIGRDEARLSSMQPSGSMAERARKILNISFDLKP